MQSNGRSRQVEIFTQRVLQIAQIGARQLIRMGAGDCESRGATPCLRDVLEANATPAWSRRWVGGDHLLQPAIEHPCRQALVPDLIGPEYRLHQAFGTASLKCR